MSELEDLRRRSERRTEAQMAAQRKRVHDKLEALRLRVLRVRREPRDQGPPF